MGKYQKNSIHILIDPDFDSERFKFINNRIVCNEIHLVAFSNKVIQNWETEIKGYGIPFHSILLDKEQPDFFDKIYEFSSFITEKHTYLCLNTNEPIISNIIINLITLEQMSNRENSSGSLYSVYNSFIRMTPIYPFWNDDCRHIFEILSKKDKSVTKSDLLKEINFYDDTFNKDKLDRALKLLELSLSQYDGFSKYRIGDKKKSLFIKIICRFELDL